VIHVSIVIAIIPVVFGMPLALVLVPPAMTSAPAAFPRFMQFVACPFCLPALRPMMLYSFMQPVIGLCDASLAIVIIRTQLRHAGKRQTTGDHCGSNNRPRKQPGNQSRLHTPQTPLKNKFWAGCGL
jgi:hypothetical protein